MPTSTWRSISTIIDIVMDLEPTPRRILDIGLGTGKYGFLCREYLQFWGEGASDNIRLKKIEIDGIESFPDYIGEIQQKIYSKIFIGSARNLLAKIKDNSYDLVPLIDVIEHFKKEDGAEMLLECQRVASVVIVSTPPIFVHQPVKWGNPCEEHLSLWTRKDLKTAGALWCTRAENEIAVFAKGAHRSQFRPLFRQMRSFYYRLPLGLQSRLQADSPWLVPIYKFLKKT